jgi:hypothetical protein
MRDRPRPTAPYSAAGWGKAPSSPAVARTGTRNRTRSRRRQDYRQSFGPHRPRGRPPRLPPHTGIPLPTGHPITNAEQTIANDTWEQYQ